MEAKVYFREDLQRNRLAFRTGYKVQHIGNNNIILEASNKKYYFPAGQWVYTEEDV